MRKIFFASLFMLAGLHSVYAESIPRHVAADNHVKVVMYDPNNVVLLKDTTTLMTKTWLKNDNIAR